MPRPLLVFDLDDTLYPERAFVLSGFAAVGAWLEMHHGVKDFYPKALHLFETGVRGDIFNRVLAELMPGEAALIPSLVELYRTHTPRIALHDDARWALMHFKPTHAMALLTDGYAVTQRKKTETLAIAPFFKTMVYSDDFGRDSWKPSAVPYEKIMAQTNSEGPDCLYIADNPNKDFIGARALGWKTVHIRRPGAEYAAVIPAPGYGADRQIVSLYELQGVAA